MFNSLYKGVSVPAEIGPDEIELARAAAPVKDYVQSRYQSADKRTLGGQRGCDKIRLDLLLSFAKWLLIASSVLILPALVRDLKFAAPLTAFHLLTYLGIVAVYLRRDRLSLTEFSYTILGVFYLVGTFGVIWFGVTSVAFLNYALLLILAPLLLGTRKGVMVGFACLATFFAIWLLNLTQLVHSGEQSTTAADSAALWLYSGIALGCFAGIVIPMAAWITHYIASLMQRESQRVQNLERANQNLDAANQQLVFINEQLEDRVQQRTTELERANTKLSASNRDLEAFAYTVSHDLRAPLRAMGGFNKLLADELQGTLSPQAQRYLDHTQEGVQRLQDMISKLLSLAQFSSAAVQRQQVNLSDIAASIVDELRVTDPDRHVDVKIMSDVYAMADKTLTRLLLQNLLCNAWKFTAKKSHSSIRFGVRNENGHNVYFVQDDGAGFDPLATDKLFRPFQRLHALEEFEGTGIGLATARRIVQRHQGKIWAESQPGAGAVFAFTLNDPVLI